MNRTSPHLWVLVHESHIAPTVCGDGRKQSDRDGCGAVDADDGPAGKALTMVLRVKPPRGSRSAIGGGTGSIRSIDWAVATMSVSALARRRGAASRKVWPVRFRRIGPVSTPSFSGAVRASRPF